MKPIFYKKISDLQVAALSAENGNPVRIRNDAVTVYGSGSYDHRETGKREFRVERSQETCLRKQNMCADAQSDLRSTDYGSFVTNPFGTCECMTRQVFLRMESDDLRLQLQPYFFCEWDDI